MTSRIRPVTVLDEDEEESVQSSERQPVTTATIDRTMESFTQELDSMEQGPDLHEMIERAKSRAEQSYNYNNSNGSAGRGGVTEAYQQQPQQQYATDPYASRSRPTEDYREAPDMRRTGSTPDSRRPVTQTMTPQEPMPVRTPPYQRQSPLPAAAPTGYSTRLEGSGDPEHGRYESSSRMPSGRAQEVNSMQSPTPGGYSKMQSPNPGGYNTRRFEGDADPGRERMTPRRAQEVNSMQSPNPGGYSTRLYEGNADPEREKRTSVRAQEVNIQSPTPNGYSKMQSPAPNGYRTTRFEGDVDPERERRTPKRADEVNMQSPIPNGYSTRRFEDDAGPERERRTPKRADEVNMQSPAPNGYRGVVNPERDEKRTYTRAEELQMQSPAAPNGYSTRVSEGHVVDPERENYENNSKRSTTSKRVEANDRGGDTNINQPPLSSVKLILDSMGNTMERQESRIRFLEGENEALRAELEYRRRDQRPVPTSTTRSSPHPEPAYSAPPPRSRPANSSTARSPVPVRETWEQNGNSAPPPARRTPPPTPSSARIPMPEQWEQQQRSAPPSASRSASKQVRSPMPSSPYEHSAPPPRNPGPGPYRFHPSGEETRHPSPPTRSPRPEQWDHQTAPPMRSLGPVMHDDRPREFMSPATNRRPEEEVVVHHHRTFSPGIKFVAELSNVMELEEGLHAPLSAVMDKYWDRIDQVRNGHGWDR